MDIVNLNPMVAPIQPVEPNGSRGGTFIYVIVVIVLLVSLVAAGFFFINLRNRLLSTFQNQRVLALVLALVQYQRTYQKMIAVKM